MNGILLIDKPQDWTSNDVIGKLRGILHERRIGHSGTLDPMATGLLVVFVGRATRAVAFSEAQEKRYLAKMRLGLVTDTQDSTGNVLREHAVQISDEMLDRSLEAFRGQIMQVPPMYSAIKVHGQKLYDIARRGGEVERAARPITIHELRALGREGDTVSLDVLCSKGTYIRTLCHDIGETLGCGACMCELRRVRVGKFRLEDAYTLSEVQQAADLGQAESLLLPLDSLFEELPALHIDAKTEKKIRVGAQVSSGATPGNYRVYGPEGSFLAIGEVREGQLCTIKSFFEV